MNIRYLMVISAFLISFEAKTAEREIGGSIRDTQYLISAMGGVGTVLRSDLGEGISSVTPMVGGTFGIRLAALYEAHFEFSRSFLDWDGKNQFGLAFNYSGHAFYGWFGQARVGWAEGANPYFALGGGYSFEVFKSLEIRPLGSVQITPTDWPLASIGLQAVMKTDSIATFLLRFFGGLFYSEN